MGLLGFESSYEKQLRLEALDRENEYRRNEARAKGLPFFGSKYSDDRRTARYKNLSEILDELKDREVLK